MRANSIISATARFCYGVAQSSGLLTTALGDRLFTAAYMLYKRRWEDSLEGFLECNRGVGRGGHIFDVGANIGYTSLLCARFVEAPYRVHAFEPEPENLARLRRNVERHGLSAQIAIHDFAAGDGGERALLWRNRNHHGDHRIVTGPFAAEAPEAESIEVAMMTLDQAWEQFAERQPVALVKIDVQGYEFAVLSGMEEMIRDTQRMTVVFEQDARLSQLLGFPRDRAARFLDERGFSLHRIGRNGALQRSSVDEISAESNEYFDVAAMRR